MAIGLALGGGAVRGLAHIGVLKVLKRRGIPVDFIAGTSIGGAVGGLVAAGIDIEEIEDFILSRRWYRLVDVGVGKGGILSGNRLRGALVELMKQKGLDNMRIEQLPIPFRAVSVDLVTGKPFVWERGRLILAIRATTSIPGIFAPVAYKGMVLVDGGVLNNLPADLVRQAGVDRVIAVDVEREHETREPRNMLEVLYRSYTIMSVALRRSNLRYADLVLRPEVGRILALDVTKMKECVDAGEQEAERHIEEIRGWVSQPLCPSRPSPV
ncbi:patatin-like phospholipase family protein [Kyrpidia tusciae]|uniref:Patatin n=1 Tax=Kyrpidia tusciae (strain DSM 2912 / NBRC 15312 / T2) TaxID=562970 RepID=D5WXF6_KYRT2|nr:patatin-like phospholipase family protein [Kyrpidia tusciae]ADG05877.1 Patatin [Kyrpidia tusciae DSM 2912]